MQYDVTIYSSDIHNFVSIEKKIRSRKNKACPLISKLNGAKREHASLLWWNVVRQAAAGTEGCEKPAKAEKGLMLKRGYFPELIFSCILLLCYGTIIHKLEAFDNRGMEPTLKLLTVCWLIKLQRYPDPIILVYHMHTHSLTHTCSLTLSY